MMPFEKIHAYSKAVCGQIRWKKAHAVVSEEIENHLVDQRNAYMADGADETTATEKAILQMGDPVTVGTQLDRTHRPKPQWGMLSLAAVFIICGIVLQIYAYWGTGHRWMLNLFITQAIGLALLAGAYFSDFTRIKRHARKIYLIVVILFSAAYVLRKLEIAWGLEGVIALLFPLVFAGVVCTARNSGYRGVIVCEAAFALPALMLLLSQDRWLRSHFVLLSVSAIVILCVAVSKGWFGVKPLQGNLLVLLPAAVALLAAVVIIASNNELFSKVIAAINPSFDPFAPESGASEIKAALAGSRFIGQGTLPEATTQGVGFGTSRMLTSLIFYTGWIFAIPVLGLLLFFVVKGFWLCSQQKSGVALFISFAAMMTFTMQVAGYVLFNLGVTLLSPISLPLIFQYSYEFYINMALLGIMLSVFRTGHFIKDNNVLTGHRIISFHNGKLSFSKK